MNRKPEGKKKAAAMLSQPGRPGREPGKPAKPQKLNKREREAKAAGAANRALYLGSLLGVTLAVVLFAIVFSVPPVMTPQELASAVKDQVVRRTPENLPNNGSVGSAHPPRATPSLANSAASSGPRERARAAPKGNQYLPVGFDRLSGFPFLVTQPMADGSQGGSVVAQQVFDQIPEDVKALDGKRVSVSGFMMPMNFEAGTTSEFLLLKSQSLCCYGLVPRITDWVNVRMTGKGVKPIVDQPITVCGIFHVGDVRENGNLVGIYGMDADKMNKAGK